MMPHLKKIRNYFAKSERALMAWSPLIEKYCAPSLREEALRNNENKDCLVRVYLGSAQGKTDATCFSLRNFELHLNCIMETALAVMHWAAKTDARDVEFVLGASSKTTGEAIDPYYFKTVKQLYKPDDLFYRPVDLWVLGFSKVRSITLDDEGVALALEAWRLNDPYFPKPRGPTRPEKHAWWLFFSSYLAMSRNILKEEDEWETIRHLPRKFIDGVVEAERARMMSQTALLTTSSEEKP
ncbi:hypothetical protein B0T24DRAFT_587861 [Lasiosphaeria ovina]|uniref:DUF3669 domain-containing protein n=1 Tax=Lasiosphaeria ovina TaxID=92902 RepID=A0AAE0TXK7_9PEZI|nr:hypothetical protein B0T24DRAFT_587861 [Lasiosphaeria ovina]